MEKANGVVTKSDVADTYKTVLIYAGETTDAPTEENIEYVNTYSTAISSATQFALKSGHKNGNYVMMLGGAGTIAEPVEATKVAFEITDDPIVDEPTLDAVPEAGRVTNENGTWNAGFAGVFTLSDYNSVILDLGTTKLAWSIDAVFGTITGDVTTSAALEIQNIPAEYAAATVYFSDYEIGGTN